MDSYSRPKQLVQFPTRNQTNVGINKIGLEVCFECISTRRVRIDPCLYVKPFLLKSVAEAANTAKYVDR